MKSLLESLITKKNVISKKSSNLFKETEEFFSNLPNITIGFKGTLSGHFVKLSDGSLSFSVSTATYSKLNNKECKDSIAEFFHEFFGMTSPDLEPTGLMVGKLVKCSKIHLGGSRNLYGITIGNTVQNWDADENSVEQVCLEALSMVYAVANYKGLIYDSAQNDVKELTEKILTMYDESFK